MAQSRGVVSNSFITTDTYFFHQAKKSHNLAWCQPWATLLIHLDHVRQLHELDTYKARHLRQQPTLHDNVLRRWAMG